ncbi:hypothetical protein GQF01_00730 [Paenibacillus sp. 5J-6]|uniref:Response regulatory domain-containing protein n=1 Tax=Paenibacillus silvestris TaxID=2606219 RepID=A0A6L8UU39_9BACL|nr:hypothetical protein [Paenibacillus silvestris]MZQ80679.1 hypothetical protein [Paenibacillus silvestris]
MFKVGLIEDDLMIRELIIDKMSRKYEEDSLEIKVIEFSGITINQIIDYIFEEKLDAVVVDHNLNGSIARVDYDGTDIALALEQMLYFYPIFILTSYDVDAEKSDYSDVNKIYKKDKYIEDETGEFVDNINTKIINQIKHYKNRLNLYEVELLELSRVEQARKLSNAEKDQLLLIDHLLETSVCGRHVTPLNLKRKDQELELIMKLAKSFMQNTESDS